MGLLLNYGFAYHDNPFDYTEVKQNKTDWKFYMKAEQLNTDLLSSLRSGTQVECNELLIIDRYAMLMLENLKNLERSYTAADDYEILGLSDPQAQV